MKKKVGCLISLATGISCLTLTGCSVSFDLFNKVPTAEELMVGAWGTEEVESIDMSVKMYMDIDISMAELTGDDTSMNMIMDLSADVQKDDDCTYLDGNIAMEMFGMSFDEDMRTYSYDGYDYTYDFDSDTWTKSESDSSDSSFNFDELVSGDSFDMSMFESYEMAEVAKEDTTYTITGVVKASDIDGIGDIAESMTDSLGTDIDYDDVKYDVIIIFDRETELIKELDFVIDASSLNTDDYSFNELTLSMIINQLNGVDVEIPDEVLNEASEETSSDSTFDFSTDTLDTSDTYSSYDNSDDTYSYFTEEATESTVDSAESSDVTGSDTLGYLLFATDERIMSSDIESVLKQYYITLPEASVMANMASLCNDYTLDELQEWLGDWDSSWNPYYKKGMAYFVDLGVFDISTLGHLGVDTVELQSLIDEIPE